MQKLTLSVPAMYADHHVLRVREALASLSGVDQDGGQRRAETGHRRLRRSGCLSRGASSRLWSHAGYLSRSGLALARLAQEPEDGSAWYMLIHRVTKTEMKDLEMSGDFRRY